MANKTTNHELPLDTAGLETFRQSYEAAMAILDGKVTVIPAFVAGDIGKVLGVVDDGEGNPILGWVAQV